MRRILTLAVGLLLGQCLTYGGAPSPAQLDTLGHDAFARQDYFEAVRLWTRAASVQPDNATFHYLRGTALARLGQRASASDAYLLALTLEPTQEVTRMVREGLAGLRASIPPGTSSESDVPLESVRGVWVAVLTMNRSHEGRFLIDTGSSVTIIGPATAARLEVTSSPTGTPLELQTLAGKTAGPSAVLRSLGLGGVQLENVPVVIHDPGPGLDGILGNTVLGRYQVTLDAARRVLRLRPLTLP